MNRTTRFVAMLISTAVCVTTAAAIEPPPLINYQGVLRDSADMPLDGYFPMVFRFWSSPVGGDEILVDSHVDAASGMVLATGGLFNVALGSGTVTDGTGGGIYTSLSEVFRDYTEIYLEVEINTEILTPRIRVLSAAYSLNAAHLDGVDSTYFLDKSPAAQSKEGPLEVNTTSFANPGFTAHGTEIAGYFANKNTTGEAYLGTESYGIEVVGGLQGGAYIGDSDLSCTALVAQNEIGINAFGSQAGGYFNKVGIGTSTPSAPLEVVGDVLVQGISEAAMGFRFPDGSVQRSSAITQNHRVVLDSEGLVGNYSSVAIGSDGYPVVAYFDDTNNSLKVAHCLDASCISKTIHTVDSPEVWGYTSIAIGADGNPIVSYYGNAVLDLKFAHCLDVDCTAAVVNTVESLGFVGMDNSIALGSDGFPVISYWDETNDDLKMAHCLDVDCATKYIGVIDSTGDVGRYSSIAIGTDLYPVISYYDQDTHALNVAHCHSLSCASKTINEVDGTGVTGQFTSIAIGTDGYPVISYYNSTDSALMVAHCLDASCGSASLDVVNAPGDVGKYSSIAIGADGFPVISYFDDTYDDLKVARCHNADCTSATVKTLDRAGQVGWWTSIAVGTDGHPVISYADQGQNDLRVMTHVWTYPGAESTAEASDVGVPVVASTRTEDRTSLVGAERYPVGVVGTGWETHLRNIWVDEEGNVYARSFRPRAEDMASVVAVEGTVEAGDVLVIDAERPGVMRLAGQVSDTGVFGVVAADPGVALGTESPALSPVEDRDPVAIEEGSLDPNSEAALVEVPVAVSGVALCKADAGYGSIRPGDLLTTSSTPGHAMRAAEPMPGTILGKALEPLETGTGLIRVLVMLR